MAPLRYRHALEVARSLPLDADLMQRAVERLVAIGSGPLGFRVAGTPEDEEAAAFAAGELEALGLSGVAVERVELDGWRFGAASLAVAGTTYEAASLGGVPPTPAGGVVGPLVDAGTGSRRELDRLDVGGRVALLDWASANVDPSDPGLELGLRGALGIAMSCPEGGPYYQTPGSLGSFNGSWHAGAPPLVTVRREDAAVLRARLAADGALEARLTLDVADTPGAAGCNVVGYLRGRREGPPIVIGAHHDGWFHGAFDNATGVAALLALARGLVAAGYEPEHDLCFTSRTAEEYGLRDSHHDWCIGAWRQVTETHPEWGAGSPFHLCLEASGHRTLRTIVESPPELRRWARGAARLAEREGWLPTGWRVEAPGASTEQWPLAVAGVPGLCGVSWDREFARTDYHTQHDTPALVEPAHLVGMVRLYALLLVDADRDPDAILDHAARARDVERACAGLGPEADGLRAAARRHAGARGRAPFTAVGRGLLAVTADGSGAYPHAQVTRDLQRLEQALAALAAGDRGGAIRALIRVGDNAHARRLSERAFAIRHERIGPARAAGSWASASHLTATPNLWTELASLRRERGSRPAGPWLAASLRAHEQVLRVELARRLDAMAAALGGVG